MTQTLSETMLETMPEASPAATQRPRNPNTVVWFELPVSDLARSTRFYEQVFQIRLATDERFPGLAMFPKREASSITGALI